MECLVQLIAGGHDNEYVNVAVGMRSAIGVRTEEDDAVWMKTLRHPPSKCTNDSHRYVCPSIPSRWGRLFRGFLRGHARIISCCLDERHPSASNENHNHTNSRWRTFSMIVTTGNEVTGHSIADYLGIVRGIV